MNANILSWFSYFWGMYIGGVIALVCVTLEKGSLRDPVWFVSVLLWPFTVWKYRRHRHGQEKRE